MSASFTRSLSRSKLLNRWGFAALIDSMAPQIRGRDRLLSTIRGKGVPVVLNREVRLDWGPGLTTHLNPSLDGSFADLFKSQWVQPALVPILDKCLTTGDLFVDIGANIGLYASWAGLLVGPGGAVIAAEPIPDTCAVLRDICTTNALAHVEIHQLAVGDRTGTTNMQVVPGASGLSSITAGSGGIDVGCTTLDELLDGRSPALVKIDVEGHELDVLRGGLNLLRRAQPVVTFESPDKINVSGTADCVELLASCGYTTYALTTRGLMKYSESHSSHNLLAIPSRDQQTLARLGRTRFPRNQNT